jgi:hypothetical protein
MLSRRNFLKISCGAVQSPIGELLQGHTLLTGGEIMEEVGATGVAEAVETLNTGQPKITGYRNLSEEEVSLMNVIKALGNQIGELIEEMTKNKTGIDQRWVNIGKTHLQQGFMALTRAVAKPTSF